MDIVEFFKTVNRLCKNRTCGECPIWKNGTCMADFFVSTILLYNYSRNGFYRVQPE